MQQRYSKRWTPQRCHCQVTLEERLRHHDGRPPRRAGFLKLGYFQFFRGASEGLRVTRVSRRRACLRARSPEQVNEQPAARLRAFCVCCTEQGFPTYLGVLFAQLAYPSLDVLVGDTNSER